MRFLKHLWENQEGKDSVEYTLLLVLISLAAISALVTLANAFGLLGGHSSATTSTPVK